MANAQEARRKQRLAQQAAAGAGKGRAPDNRPPGGFALNDSHAPEDAWTKLAHALFQTNEAMFLN